MDKEKNRKDAFLDEFANSASIPSEKIFADKDLKNTTGEAMVI